MSNDSDSITKKIKELHELKIAGAISEDEFQTLKKNVMTDNEFEKEEVSKENSTIKKNTISYLNQNNKSSAITSEYNFWRKVYTKTNIFILIVIVSLFVFNKTRESITENSESSKKEIISYQTECLAGNLDSCIYEFFRSSSSEERKEYSLMLKKLYENEFDQLKNKNLKKLTFFSYLNGAVTSNSKEITLDLCLRDSYVPACAKMALEDGKGLQLDDTDKKIARNTINNACESKDPIACMLRALTDQSINILESIKKSCDYGLLSNCLVIADDLLAKDKTEEAISLYKSLCPKKLPHACARIGTAIYKKISKTKGLEELIKLCKQDDSESCYMSAAIYQEQSEAANAEIFYEKGCNLDFSKSCYVLVNEFYFPQKKYAKAIREVDTNCTMRSHPPSCSLLGKIYGELNNIKDAELYYSKGCDGGDGEGCLGVVLWELKKNNTDIKKVKEFSNLSKIYLDQECKEGIEVSCNRYQTLITLAEKFGI